jgi:hypothetical protein
LDAHRNYYEITETGAYGKKKKRQKSNRQYKKFFSGKQPPLHENPYLIEYKRKAYKKA